MPSVSIVTATYNRSQILRHAIASVVAQRFTDWELIVVGDACTDDTAEVVAAFGDARIRYHTLDRNIGEQSGPNNAGVARARGRLIAFLNHDDLWFADHLDELMAAIDRTRADLVFSLMASIIPGHRPVLSNVAPTGHYEPRIVVPASSWLFRRELVERIGEWRSYRACYQAPSQDWLLRAFRAGADMRMVERLSVLAFPSGYRRNSYLSHDDSEHASFAARLHQDPRFRDDILTSVVLAQAAGDPLALSQSAVRPYLVRGTKNAVRAMLSRAGVSPAAVRLFLASPRRGHFIDSLRQARGLPALPRGTAK